MVWCIDTEETMKNLSSFYIQKAFDQMAGPVKNAFRLPDAGAALPNPCISLSVFHCTA